MDERVIATVDAAVGTFQILGVFMAAMVMWCVMMLVGPLEAYLRQRRALDEYFLKWNLAQDQKAREKAKKGFE